MPYPVLDVARYIINYCNDHGYSISNLKLQKILYFVQAQFLVSYNSPCFEEQIQAWSWGPVVPEVYHYYKFYGGDHIPKQRYYDTINSEQDRQLIDNLIDKLKDYSAAQLVDITHKQLPWKSAYRPYFNNEISQASIMDFFKS